MIDNTVRPSRQRRTKLTLKNIVIITLTIIITTTTTTITIITTIITCHTSFVVARKYLHIVCFFVLAGANHCITAKSVRKC